MVQYHGGGAERSVDYAHPCLSRRIMTERLNMHAVSGTFVLHAIFGLIVSILIALDIVAAAGLMTNLDVTATDIGFIEP